MGHEDSRLEDLRHRDAPLDMDPEEFRQLGHRLVEDIAGFLSNLRDRPVTPAESATEVRRHLGFERPLPDDGIAAAELLEATAPLLFDHSLFNSHPRFLAYITAGGAPIGALGDLLAAVVNPNMGGWALSPMATEIELQTVRWIAELIDYPSTCGGLLVSGGNMANLVCFYAARAAKAGWNIREEGSASQDAERLCVYVSAETHTWIQKAADLAGLGTNAVRWIATDENHRMDIEAVRLRIAKDLQQGFRPFLVVGTAGTIGTGGIDRLTELAAVCREHDLWFHVDGAYGCLAAAVPEFAKEFSGMELADSLAVDPHKWLYSPLEAGCALVKDPQTLVAAFAYRPSYYHFDDDVTNFFELGPQNSRGFRALKVWLALQQAGRRGYVKMIGDDIRLARHLWDIIDSHRELQPLTQNLSITTFRFVPTDLSAVGSETAIEEYLNTLNRSLLERLERSGEAYLSNAMLGERFALRACVVNFRTTLDDIEALPLIVTRLGHEADAELRPEELLDPTG